MALVLFSKTGSETLPSNFNYKYLEGDGMVDESGMIAAVTTVVAADNTCASADPPSGIIAVWNKKRKNSLQRLIFPVIYFITITANLVNLLFVFQ